MAEPHRRQPPTVAPAAPPRYGWVYIPLPMHPRQQPPPPSPVQWQQQQTATPRRLRRVVTQQPRHRGTPSPPWTWAPPDPATALPKLFNTMSLNDPTSTNWFMDTGATDHVHANTGILNYVLDKHDTRSILVGNGSQMPVVTTGHAPFPLKNPYRPLHLRNILISPNIIKNLISVRQFTRQNKTSIEFDSFGFTIKDYKTRVPDAL